jgi:hypothetical protein
VNTRIDQPWYSPHRKSSIVYYSILIILDYLILLDVDVTGNITAKLCEVWSEFKKICTLVTMATATILKGIQNYFKFLLFCFHGNCSKFCPTDSDLFGLSRSTRCGYCSYQVSSISVWRVTCYDHFCVFSNF